MWNAQFNLYAEYLAQKNPAGSLFPFSKDLCDLDRE